MNELRSVNKGRISLIKILKKLEIDYSYIGGGEWKDIIINIE